MIKILNIILFFSIISFTNATEVFIDTENRYTIEDIASNKVKFTYSNKLSYDISKNTYWLKIKLKNSYDFINSQYIVFSYPLLKYIEAYSLEDKKYVLKLNGYSVPIKNREIKVNNYVFHYKLQPYEEKIIYVKIKNDMSNILNYRVVSNNDFYNLIKNTSSIKFLLLSGLFVMLIYNLFICIILKSKRYFLYILYLISTIVFVSTITTTHLGEFTQYKTTIHILSTGTLSLFLLMFFYSFKRKEINKFIEFIYKAAFINALLFMILYLTNIDFMVENLIFRRFMLLYILFSMLTILLYFLYKGYKEIKYILLGWIIFLIGALVQVLFAMSILQNSIFKYGLAIGSLIEAIIFSIVLAYNYKLTQEKLVLWKEKYLKELKADNKIKNKLLDKYIIYGSIDLKGTITEISQAFSNISGYKKESLLGKSYNLIIPSKLPQKVVKNVLNKINKDKVWLGEIKHYTKDGYAYWMNTQISPIFKANIKIGYFGIGQDITHKKILEKMSMTDDLTKIYNRRYFNKIFPKELNKSKRGNELILNFALLDIDYFKNYNDIYGHQQGDMVLQKVGNILSLSLKRTNDYCFRLGGEEFGILFYSQTKEKSVDYCDTIRQNIENLKIEHKENSVSNFITASFGLYIIDLKDDKNDFYAIYKNADEMLYKAKKDGRNRVVSNKDYI